MKNIETISKKKEIIYNCVFWGIALLILIISINGCSSKDQSVETVNNPPVAEVKEETTPVVEEVKEDKSYKLMFGDLLETHENDGVLVIKAKIEPAGSNKKTINQNGFNIEDLILNQNVGDKFSEIQYWAVADMTNGSESKVISFTINSDLINQIKNKNVVGNQIVDHASDVWILKSLQ